MEDLCYQGFTDSLDSAYIFRAGSYQGFVNVAGRISCLYTGQCHPGSVDVAGCIHVYMVVTQGRATFQSEGLMIASRAAHWPE